MAGLASAEGFGKLKAHDLERNHRLPMFNQVQVQLYKWDITIRFLFVFSSREGKTFH